MKSESWTEKKRRLGVIEPNQEGRVIEPPNGSQERGCEQSSYATTATSEDGKHRVRAVPESILRLSLDDNRLSR